MLNYQSLLLNEYFPGELPPCFNTKDLAQAYKDVFTSLSSLNRDYSIPVKYSGYKSETSRRTFAIPNPYHYCKAAKLIVDSFDDLYPIFKSSHYSLTAPRKGKAKKGQAYLKRSNCVADSKKEIEKCFQDNKYEIRLDINSFVDIFYTHSIPWAIHGKKAAKSNRNDRTLLGNRIDEVLRSLNYEQTNGILIGNAVSRIVSEIILCNIDIQIKKQFPNIECCRFVDDYYIYTKERSQIQLIIAFIRNCLAQYELSFNENKIQINESPFIYGKPWVEKIKQYIHLSPDIFLTKLVSEYKEYDDISIFKYGLKILYHCDYNVNAWITMQSRLINLLVKFPSLAELIMMIFLKNKEKLKLTSIKNAVYSIIDESILLNREQELLWALWFVKVFDIKISKNYIYKVFEASSDLSTILLLSIIDEKEKKADKRINAYIENIRAVLDNDDIDDKGRPNSIMWGSHWLLAYESNRNKWLNLPNNPAEYAKKNSFFNTLLKKNIKFFDRDYTYSLSEDTSTNFEYATKSELKDSINKLKHLIRRANKRVLEKMKLVNDQNEDENENAIYDRIIELVEGESTYYL